MPGAFSVSAHKAARSLPHVPVARPASCCPPSHVRAEFRPNRRRSARPMNMFDPWLGMDFTSPFLEALGANTAATQRFGLRRMLLDVIEEDEKFEIIADIPGVDKNDIKVAVDGGVLTISVEHSLTQEATIPESSSDSEKADGKASRILHRQERVHEYDNRVIRLPDSADMEQVDAQSHDGVLTISIPKKEHAVAKRRTIPVA